MQGKRLVAVAAAKRHTVVMTNEGDIFTWGHRVVTPRRVQLAGKPLLWKPGCKAQLYKCSILESGKVSEHRWCSASREITSTLFVLPARDRICIWH